MVGQDLRALIQDISIANPRGSPLVLGADARPVQPPDQSAIIDVPEVGGLHHHYEPMAA